MASSSGGYGKTSRAKKEPSKKQKAQKLIKHLRKTTTGSAVAKLLKDNKDIINGFVVSTAMGKLRNFGVPEDALMVFEKTRAQGVTPNVFTFNAAISASERLRDWKKALDFFGQLKQRGMQPTIITYNALISACEKRSEEHTSELKSLRRIEDALEKKIKKMR